MKTLSGFVAFVLGAAAARAEVAFQGYMVTPERSLFVLSINKERTSKWLMLGQSFDGFLLLAFDPKANHLTVEKDGTRYALWLVESKIQASSESAPIVVSISGQDSIILGGDRASLDALKARLAVVAAMVPQPMIVLRATATTTREQIEVNTVIELLRKVGINRSTVMGGKEQNQAPTPGSVTPREK